jgi:monofunctional biosynthetic peptidoglycan transglycosylase
MKWLRRWRRRRATRRRSPVFTAFTRFPAAWRWGWGIALFLLMVDLAYVGAIWPDWRKLSAGPVPKSQFIKRYEVRRRSENWPPVAWHPVPLSDIPPHMQRAVIVAEDSRFFEHDGFDLIAFKEAMGENLQHRNFRFGASTISQQTVKNLLLTPTRNPLRKWHELLLTWGMEGRLSKHRILEIYLNIAEFGRGVYGVDAAAQAYWGIPASALSVEQAAELAASLPSPVKQNPVTRTDAFMKRKARTLRWLMRELEPGATGEEPFPAWEAENPDN